jgi:Asp-tRNA(Asn)/Glu-tRNA(Gln) amidotransferase A subunit family amidase
MTKNNSYSNFFVEEASIADLHQAIQEGRTTCVDVVKQYIARIKKYNGPSSLLVTQDGADIPPSSGTIRAGEAIDFDQTTVKASELLPNLKFYQGPPLEFGRME